MGQHPLVRDSSRVVRLVDDDHVERLRIELPDDGVQRLKRREHHLGTELLAVGAARRVLGQPPATPLGLLEDHFPFRQIEQAERSPELDLETAVVKPGEQGLTETRRHDYERARRSAGPCAGELVECVRLVGIGRGTVMTF